MQSVREKSHRLCSVMLDQEQRPSSANPAGKSNMENHIDILSKFVLYVVEKALNKNGKVIHEDDFRHLCGTNAFYTTIA